MFSALEFQGHVFTGATRGQVDLTEPWNTGVVPRATYALLPNPLRARDKAWDSGVGMFYTALWFDPKVATICFVATANTWLLVPRETSGRLGFEYDPPGECTEITGCEGTGDDGVGTGSGGGGPVYRCTWEVRYVEETGQILSITFLGCSPA